MATVELTKDNFESTVNDNPIVIVDFWAPWCGPCRGFAPVFEKASETHADVVFAKVNTDEQQELAGAFQIQSAQFLTELRMLRGPCQPLAEPERWPPHSPRGSGHSVVPLPGAVSTGSTAYVVRAQYCETHGGCFRSGPAADRACH